MFDNSSRPLSRRGLLRLAIFGAACSAAGCGDAGTAGKVETPAVPGANRKRLDLMQEKASQSVAKKKT